MQFAADVWVCGPREEGTGAERAKYRLFHVSVVAKYVSASWLQIRWTVKSVQCWQHVHCHRRPALQYLVFSINVFNFVRSWTLDIPLINLMIIVNSTVPSLRIISGLSKALDVTFLTFLWSCILCRIRFAKQQTKFWKFTIISDFNSNRQARRQKWLQHPQDLLIMLY